MSNTRLTWRPATADDVGRLCRTWNVAKPSEYYYGELDSVSSGIFYVNGTPYDTYIRCEVQDVDGSSCQCAGELQLRRKQMARYPFCPDHRDKVSGKPCRECENEHMRMLLKASHHLLMGSIGPSDGPTSWMETRSRLLNRMRPFINDGGEA